MLLVLLAIGASSPVKAVKTTPTNTAETITEGSSSLFVVSVPVGASVESLISACHPGPDSTIPSCSVVAQWLDDGFVIVRLLDLLPVDATAPDAAAMLTKKVAELFPQYDAANSSSSTTTIGVVERLDRVSRGNAVFSVRRRPHVRDGPDALQIWRRQVLEHPTARVLTIRGQVVLLAIPVDPVFGLDSSSSSNNNNNGSNDKEGDNNVKHDNITSTAAAVLSAGLPPLTHIEPLSKTGHYPPSTASRDVLRATLNRMRARRRNNNGSGNTNATAAAIAAPDPVIKRMVDSMTAESMEESVKALSGEGQDWSTRNSYSTGYRQAAAWLLARYTKLGFKAVYEEFDKSIGPNVIATLVSEANPTKWVVFGAHLDCRARDRNSPTDKAPGANDDASGVAVQLEFAKAISSFGAEFEYSVMIASFGGEEQGLLGSAALAQRLKRDGSEVVAMFATDMVAYRPSTRSLQTGVSITSVEPLLNDLYTETAKDYTPELEVCTSTSCCTDQRSFYDQGFPAMSLFEFCGPMDDPEYHSVTDVVGRTGYDIKGQLLTTAKAVGATAFEILKLAE